MDTIDIKRIKHSEVAQTFEQLKLLLAQKEKEYIKLTNELFELTKNNGKTIKPDTGGKLVDE